jgi:hypothetical protein
LPTIAAVNFDTQWNGLDALGRQLMVTDDKNVVQPRPRPLPWETSRQTAGPQHRQRQDEQR